MSKYIKLEDAKVAIREKFKSIEDRVEINSVLNGLPTLNITEYADKHQAYSEGYAKGVVYGGLLKSEVSEEQLSKLKSSENSVENTTASEDFTSISRANSKLEVSEDAISREDAVNALIAHFIPQTYTGEEVEQATKLAWKIMANAPSVVPKPKEGEWIYNGNSIEPMWNCSECGKRIICGKAELPNYCEDCGAKKKGASR